MSNGSSSDSFNFSNPEVLARTASKTNSVDSEGVYSPRDALLDALEGNPQVELGKTSQGPMDRPVRTVKDVLDIIRKFLANSSSSFGGGGGGTTTVVEKQNTLVSYEYTASGGQTAFTGADANGRILKLTEGNALVYVNGSLVSTSEYTVDSSGTRVTLDTPSTANDKIVITAINDTLNSIPTTAAFITDRFTADGVTERFPLTSKPKATNQIQVHVNGIGQDEDTYELDEVDGVVFLDFGEAFPSGYKIRVNAFLVNAPDQVVSSQVTYQNEGGFEVSLQDELDSINSRLDDSLPTGTFSTILADTGSTTATTANESLTVQGGTGISTQVVGDTVLITSELNLIAGDNIEITGTLPNLTIASTASGGGGGGPGVTSPASEYVDRFTDFWSREGSYPMEASPFASGGSQTLPVSPSTVGAGTHAQSDLDWGGIGFWEFITSTSSGDTATFISQLASRKDVAYDLTSKIYSAARINLSNSVANQRFGMAIAQGSHTKAFTILSTLFGNSSSCGLFLTADFSDTNYKLGFNNGGGGGVNLNLEDTGLPISCKAAGAFDVVELFYDPIAGVLSCAVNGATYTHTGFAGITYIDRNSSGFQIGLTNQGVPASSERGAIIDWYRHLSRYNGRDLIAPSFDLT